MNTGGATLGGAHARGASRVNPNASASTTATGTPTTRTATVAAAAAVATLLWRRLSPQMAVRWGEKIGRGTLKGTGG